MCKHSLLSPTKHSFPDLLSAASNTNDISPSGSSTPERERKGRIPQREGCPHLDKTGLGVQSSGALGQSEMDVLSGVTGRMGLMGLMEL